MSTLSERRALETLKPTISQLVGGRHVSYADICAKDELADMWTPQELKQFVYRSAVPRNNAKNVALAKVVVGMVSRSETLKSIQSLAESIDVIREGLHLDSNLAPDASVVDEKFDLINKNSKLLRLSENYAFCRFNAEHKYIVIIIVNIKESSSGKTFTMKISGSKGNKRLVLGNVSHTISATYLNGIAFNISSAVSNEEFASLEAAYIETNPGMFSMNPVGQEMIAIRNHALYQTEFGVNFCGLDGRGDPISGTGFFINEGVFSAYNIQIDKPSIIQCVEKQSMLVNIMKQEGFHTCEQAFF